MRKILLLTTLFFSVLMMAGPVDQETAKRKALDFAAAKMGVRTQRTMKATDCGVHKASNRVSAARDYLHVFNIDGGGYIIVSGDDRTEEILGYSTTGTFDANNMPENMRAFLQEYADGIQALDDNNVQVAPTISKYIKKKEKGIPYSTNRVAKSAIAPLLKTTWDQWAPYSLYCPRSGNKLTLTGCVATAMAQVMGYHRWPAATTTDIPAYTSSGQFSIAATPAGTGIDWENIKNSYTCDYSMTMTESEADASQKAIGRLMQLCGQSVMMDYGTGGSSATTALCISALIKYFDYDASAQWLLRKNYSYSEWQDIIYAELAANRPVLYDGQSAGGGHAFVCDGYDSDDFFHINWGWSGGSNDYFRLRLLNPDDQGAGGSTTNDGYGVDQGAGINIKRNAGSTNNYNGLMVTQLTTREESLTRTSSTADFIFTAYFNFANYGFLSNQDVAFQVLNSSEEVVKTINMTSLSLGPAYHYMSEWYWNLYLGSDLANGNYKLVISSRENDTEKWKICAGCDVNNLQFTISGNTLTFTHGYEIKDIEVTADVTGNGEVNSPQTITLHIKNNGTVYRDNLSYKVNSTSNSARSYTAGYIEVEPGQTEDISFTYSNSNAGTYTLYIYNGNNDMIKDVQVVIGAQSGTADLTGTYNYATPAISYDSSQDVYYVEGTSTTANFTVTNNGDVAYNDNIVFNFWYYSISDSKWKYYKEDVQAISLAAGGSQNLNVTIDKVDNSDYALYAVEMNWIKDEKETYIATTPDFEFRGSSAGYKLEAVEYNCTPEMKYNSDASLWYINGTEAEFYIDIKNTGTETFTGQLMVEQAYHNAGGGSNWYYKDYPTYPEYRDFTLAPGETKREKTTITKIDQANVDLYFVRIKYKASNESDYTLLEYSPNFAFMEANEPKLTFKNLECSPTMYYDSEKGVSYVEGDKMTPTFNISNVGTGAFDGKIKFKYFAHSTSENKWKEIKTATTHDFNLAAGATGSVTSEPIEKTSGYDLYTINCYYVAGTTDVFIRRTSDFEFRIATIQPGDANGDGQVNVTDIVAIVNYIMDNPPAGFNFTAADVNNDGAVNVTDIVQIVNIIMSSGARMDSEEVYKILKANGFIFKGE